MKNQEETFRGFQLTPERLVALDSEDYCHTELSAQLWNDFKSLLSVVREFKRYTSEIEDELERDLDAEDVYNNLDGILLSVPLYLFNTELKGMKPTRPLSGLEQQAAKLDSLGRTMLEIQSRIESLPRKLEYAVERLCLRAEQVAKGVDHDSAEMLLDSVLEVRGVNKDAGSKA